MRLKLLPLLLFRIFYAKFLLRTTVEYNRSGHRKVFQSENLQLQGLQLNYNQVFGSNFLIEERNFSVAID